MARKFVPSKHPRDRFGRFTRSRSAAANPQDRERAAEVAAALKPKRGITGAQASGYLQPIARDEHRQAVADYTGGGYVDTHKALRAGKTGDPSVQAMDAAMIELPDDLVVSRRVPKAQFGDIDVDELLGLKVKDAAYSPASLGAVRATKGDVRLRIAVPKGTRAAVNPDTGEVILDRDLEMVVARVERNPAGNADVFLTVLPKNRGGNNAPATGTPGRTAKKAPAKKAPASEPAAAEPDEQPEGGEQVRKDLMKLKVPQLRALMLDRDLKPGKLRKSQMVDALVGDETGTQPTPGTGDERPARPEISFDDRVGAAAFGDDALNSVPLSLIRAETHARLGNRGGLSGASREALADYREASYTPINRRLRTGETVDPRTEKWIADIDAAMTASPLPSDTVTWRGLRTGLRIFGERLGGDLTGFAWREDAYVSSSTERSIADQFAGSKGVRMRMLTPAGVGAVQVSGSDGVENEAEILLERGVSVRVVADRGVGPDGVRDLDVEVIPVEAVGGEG